MPAPTTPLPIVFVIEKGGPLTILEFDGNNRTLKEAIEWLIDHPPAPLEISNVTVTGSQLRFFREDGMMWGPFTLRTARFTWRGEWAPDTVYSELDVVKATGLGVYLVLVSHTSAADSSGEFDPDAVSGDSDPQPLYALMLESPTPARGVAVADGEFTPTPDQAGRYFRCGNVGGTLVHLTDEFRLDSELHFRQGDSAGAVSFPEATGTSLLPPMGRLAQTRGPGAVCTAKYAGAGAWELFGDLAEDASA